jgi:Holliday junction DNA helicase RuvA
MIASLRGTLASLGKGSVVIDVGGVGFQVLVPRTLLEGGLQPGEPLALFTHLQVRENELTLYGFRSEDELGLFRLLQTVTGVGPKAALSILSALPPDRLQQALAQEDEATLARVPGIGPKTAKKLVFDLKDKVSFEVTGMAPRPTVSSADVDLVAALTGLGFSLAEAQDAIRALPLEALPFEERVRLALLYLGSGR